MDKEIESAADLEAETGHLAEVKEEDVRQQVITEFGFDPESDKEKIEKAVKKELGHKKNLSTAIGQKVKYRNEYTKLKGTPPAPSGDKGLTGEDLDKRLAETFEKRDLESMEYPDDLKAVIQNVAKINGVSVKKAVSDPYVAAKIEAWKKTKSADDASISRNNRSGAGKSGDMTEPPNVDMSTKEGRAEYDKWKADMIAKGF